jgi:hypothetical protein
MGFYNRFILPHVIGLAMRQQSFAPFRERVVGRRAGRVLEIGLFPVSTSRHTGPVCGRGLWSRPFDRASGESRQSSEYRANPGEIG